jgi:hypothetical protein
MSHHEGDYMAAPSVERMLQQGQHVLQYLHQAEQSGHRLEDWVESKLTTMATDMNDVFGYVTYSPHAKEAAVRGAAAAFGAFGLR